MTKHTPGPWHCVGEDELIPGVPALMIERDVPDGPDAKEICSVSCSLDQTTDTFFLSYEDIANASLIAAAPEMYEALMDLYDLISRWPRTISDGDYGKVTNAASVLAKVGDRS